MKKSNYLNYLNQYHDKIPLNMEKTFKQLKKQLKSKTIKQAKNKDCYNRVQNTPYLSIQTRAQNKENLHPNFNFPNQNDGKPMKRSESIFIHPDPNIKIKQKQTINNVRQITISAIHNVEKKYYTNELKLSLTRCNFQAAHSSDNLYLIQTQGHQEFIVCEKCSQIFTKRLKLTQIKKNNPSKYSYAHLVERYESLQQQSKKIKRIKFIQKENLHQNLNKVSTYYTQLIQKLIDAKDQLEKEIIEVYEMNSLQLSKVFQQNQRNLKKLDKRIQEMQQSCINNMEMKQVENDQIYQILTQKTKTQIELCSIDLKIPLNIIDDFEADFTSSKFCIKLFQNSLEQKHLSKNQNQQVIDQIEQVSRETSEKIMKKQSKASLSSDFEKELPFNVDFQVTETKDVNFSHKMDEALSKISSSEQLLIESLRYRQYNQTPFNVQNKLLQVNIEEFQIEKNHNVNNFKTQASTHRAQESKQENDCSKKNFIKHLHVESNNDINDMICDQDLTLSYSHPIYENQPIQTRNSLKLSKQNPKKTDSFPLTLSQLDSQLVKEQKHSQIAKSSITDPSIIAASENKHEISFQLDENLIIDANILPEEYDGHQNLDIISPAFKII